VLGSRSTFARGLRRPRAAGRRHCAGQGDECFGGVRIWPAGHRPRVAPDLLHRGRSAPLVGLYDYQLAEDSLETFFTSAWMLTPVADRIGLRFAGPEIEWKPRTQPFGAGSDPSNIVDAGYAVGSIQIPGGKGPIVQHRDAVSGGGYAMVATVVSADMDIFVRSQRTRNEDTVPRRHDGRGPGSPSRAEVPSFSALGNDSVTSRGSTAHVRRPGLRRCSHARRASAPTVWTQHAHH
jgi:allophanate hydrolase subunit 2